MLGKRSKKRNSWSQFKRKHKEALNAMYVFSDGRCSLCNTWIPYLEGQVTRKNGNHATFDHIIPICDGGENSLDNLRMVCYDCNHGLDYINNPERYIRIKRSLRKI